jgi:energy-coupling factor transporter ATP-binding protein EcfA2
MMATNTLKNASSAPNQLNRPVEDWKDLGLKQAFLKELALKTLFLGTELSSRELAEQMKLTVAVADQLVLWLRKEQFCEVKGFVGGIYRIAISAQGRDRAVDALSRNGYVGPTPVPLRSYTEQVLAQSVRQTQVRPTEVAQIFRHLVLDEQALERLGTAMASGTTLFLYGPPGTGKTAIAEAMAGAFSDTVWIPHAIEVDGEVITIFEPGIHRPEPIRATVEYDQRWVLCQRPCVILGGELTIEMLDLQINPANRFYAAPPQIKANNGILVIDDFGRQRVHPEDLLNRWIVPLDRHFDLLSLAGGKKFDVPFDLMVVFATNLELKNLGDDAFLRRMGNKIRLTHASREQFHQIFELIANDYGVEYDAALVDHLIDLLIHRFREPLRPCYPRDILRQVQWMARYHGGTPRLDETTLETACTNYFLAEESDRPRESAVDESSILAIKRAIDGISASIQKPKQ